MNESQIVSRPCWTPNARTLGVSSGFAILAIGVLYVGAIVLWVVAEATPREPIGDPYLAIMEVLTVAPAVALVGLVVALHSFADSEKRGLGVAVLTVGVSGALLTSRLFVRSPPSARPAE